MSFRHDIIAEVERQLNLLVIPGGQTQARPQGRLELTPNTGYSLALRKVYLGPLNGIPRDNPPIIPAAYVSAISGEKDLAGATFNTNLLETFSFLIELHLSEKIGIGDDLTGSGIRDLTLQLLDGIMDVERLITRDRLTAVVTGDNILLQQVIVSDWEADTLYEGGPYEVINITYECEVDNPVNPP